MKRPNFVQLMRQSIRRELAMVHTSIPATVLDYDAEEQTVTAQIGVRFSRVNSEGERIPYDPPPLPNVPVLWAAGGGGDYSDTWPLEEGDELELIFAERSIDEWVITDGDVVTPADTRRFNLTDAVALPVRSSAELPDEALSTDARVIRGPLIRMGSAAADDHVALASRVQAELDALWEALENHSHSYTPGESGTAQTGSGPSGSAGDVGASKVMAE